MLNVKERLFVQIENLSRVFQHNYQKAHVITEKHLLYQDARKSHSLSEKKKKKTHWENTDVESFDKDFKVANIKLIQ